MCSTLKQSSGGFPAAPMRNSKGPELPTTWSPDSYHEQQGWRQRGPHAPGTNSFKDLDRQGSVSKLLRPPSSAARTVQRAIYSRCSPANRTCIVFLACFSGVFLLLNSLSPGSFLLPKNGPPRDALRHAPRWAAFSRQPLRRHVCTGRADALPQLRLEAAHRSRRPRLKTDITVVTQCSRARMNLVELACKRWPGVYAVAVYVPLIPGGTVLGPSTLDKDGNLVVNNASRSQQLGGAVQELEDTYQSIESAGGAKLDLSVYSETVTLQILDYLYPVNAMRNRALMLADTEMVVLLDVDFLAADELGAPQQVPLLHRITRSRRLVVLPAFEPVGRNSTKTAAVALQAIAGGVGVAVGMWNSSLVQFHKDFDAAHAATNYTRWLASDPAYPIPFQQYFEPYVVAARAHVPWYDERYRGYFRNKAIHSHHMWLLGLRFVVHPSAFVVHYPHPKSGMAAAMTTFKRINRVKALYNLSLAEMEAGVYQPRTAFTCLFPDPHASLHQDPADVLPFSDNRRDPSLAALSRAPTAFQQVPLEKGDAAGSASVMGRAAVEGEERSDAAAGGGGATGGVDGDNGSVVGDGDAEAD